MRVGPTASTEVATWRPACSSINPPIGGSGNRLHELFLAAQSAQAEPSATAGVDHDPAARRRRSRARSGPRSRRWVDPPKGAAEAAPTSTRPRAPGRPAAGVRVRIGRLPEHQPRDLEPERDRLGVGTGISGWTPSSAAFGQPAACQRLVRPAIAIAVSVIAIVRSDDRHRLVSVG